LESSERLTAIWAPAGVCTCNSGIDIALWDIKGKACNLPLAKMVGGHRERVVTYASAR
jgi:L-alanine-DL-glutamate epimerase-like enolase superfamily enzyme